LRLKRDGRETEVILLAKEKRWERGGRETDVILFETEQR
jgi:hypothetical protein